jgi:hypothetical protein
MKEIDEEKNVNQVFIFTSSISKHEEWIKNYPNKIKCLSVKYKEIEEKVREAVRLNDISLALGANNEVALLKEVVDHNIGNQIIKGNFVHP